MLGWIPRPVSWLRTIVLVAIFLATTGTLRVFGTYGAFFTYESNHLGYFVFMSLIGLLIPCVVYAYIHSGLIGKKPEGWSNKIPAPSSIKEAALTFVVMIFGVGATLILIFPFLPTYSSKTELDTFSSICVFIWLFLTVYMFHGYHLISRAFAKKSVDKPKTEAPKTKVDPVDLELNRLKHQNGQMINQPTKKDI